MSPVEAFIGGKFSGGTGESECDIIINDHPPYHVYWSGDNSQEHSVSVYRIDESTGQPIPVAETSLPKTGDIFSTGIEVGKPDPLFKGALRMEQAELTLKRTK